MLPAHQGLGPVHAQAVHVHDRLVEDDDLVGVEPTPEFAEHVEPADRVAVKRGRVDLAARVGLLSRVHGDVGAPEQRVGIIAIAREAGDSDAHPHLERHLVHLDGLLDACHQATRDRLELIRVAGVLTRKHRELVAAEPRHEPLGSDHLPQPRSEIAQHLIAEVVAERVVDLLEAVEVEQHHAERLARPSRGRDPFVEPRAEPLAVGEAGQFVGGGDPVELSRRVAWT